MNVSYSFASSTRLEEPTFTVSVTSTVRQPIASKHCQSAVCTPRGLQQQTFAVLFRVFS